MTVELVGIEVEELVDQLGYGLGIPRGLLRDVVFLDSLEVSFKESICLSQAIDLLGRVFSLVTVVSSSPLALQQVNRHRVVNISLVLPVSDFFHL